jgi:hypothetical protein
MDRPLLALALLALSLGLGGCMLGAGPTVGVRTTGEFSLGWEASGSMISSHWRGGGGAQIGQSIPFGPRRSTVYFAGQGFWRFLEASEEDDDAGYFGGAGGFAVREGGTQPHASMWAMALTGTISCAAPSDRDPVLTLQLGVRLIAGVGELYLAPKVNSYGNVCPD